MSGCKMLELVATCLAGTCLNKRLHVWLQHVSTGCNIMLHCVTTSLYYGLLDVILVAMQTKLKIFKKCPTDTVITLMTV
jgi:hypothetical protein